MEGDRRPGRQGSQRRLDGLSAGPDGGAAAGTEDCIFVDRTAAPAVRPVEPVAHASARDPALRRHSAPATAPAGSAAAGQVVKGDYLSRLLHRDEIGWQLTLIGIAVAFGLGAMHAMSPGHGKTIVAAYLVGSRGTFKHAMFLGAMVTFTHTASVFLLGFVTLFLSKYVLPEKLFPILGAISGLSIVWVGTMLFFRRLRARGHASRSLTCITIDHDHAHGHVHDHGDGHSHSHVPEGEITMGSLIALGASGGLVPCPSALVVLLSAISLGRVGLGHPAAGGLQRGAGRGADGHGSAGAVRGQSAARQPEGHGQPCVPAIAGGLGRADRLCRPGDDGSVAGADSRAAGGVKDNRTLPDNPCSYKHSMPKFRVHISSTGTI